MLVGVFGTAPSPVQCSGTILRSNWGDGDRNYHTAVVDITAESRVVSIV